jgi:hypothetical protein
MTELTIIFEKTKNCVVIGEEKIIFKNAVLISHDAMLEKVEFKALPAADGTIYEVQNDTTT